MRLLLLFLLSVVLMGNQSFANSSEEMSYQRTQDRLEKLEKEISSLQESLYKSRKSRSSGEPDNMNSAKTDAIMGAVDEKMRDINGKIEEVQNNIDVLSKRLDKVVSDIDFRLAALEKTVQENAENAAKNAAAAKEQAQTQAQAELAKSVEEQASKATTEKSDEALTEKETPFAKEEKAAEKIPEQKAEEEKKVDIKPAEESKKEEKKEEKKTDAASDQYDKAFQLMRQSKYDEAEKAWKEFIEKNGKSDLISNAYYWLGETYYVRSNYESSAINFLKGYQKLPKGNKAEDNLFKLASSLARLKKDKEACTTFDKLVKEFPKADKDLKGKVKEEKTRLKCK